MASTHNTRSSAIKSPQSIGPDTKAQNNRNISRKRLTVPQRRSEQQKSSKKVEEKVQKLDKVKESPGDKIGNPSTSDGFVGRNLQKQNVSSEIKEELISSYDGKNPRKSPRSGNYELKSGTLNFEGSGGNSLRSTVEEKRNKVDDVNSSMNVKGRETVKTPNIKRKNIQTSGRAGSKRKIENDEKNISESENEDDRKLLKRNRVSTTHDEISKDLYTGKRNKNINENKQITNQVDEHLMKWKQNEEKSVEILSPPRRSSRTVIPNRKFKDMEVDYTPNKRNSKGTVDSDNKKTPKENKTKKDRIENKSKCTSTDVIDNETKRNNENMKMENENSSGKDEKQENSSGKDEEQENSSGKDEEQENSSGKDEEQENSSGKDEEQEYFNTDSETISDKPVQDSQNKSIVIPEFTSETGKSTEIKKIADTVFSQNTDEEMNDNDDDSSDNYKDIAMEENSAEIENLTFSNDEDGNSSGLIDPVTGLINGIKEGDNGRILDGNSELVESSVQAEETGGEVRSISKTKDAAESNKIVITPFKDKVLGTLTVSEAPEDGNTIITSDGLHIEDVPVVEVTLSTETTNSSSEMDIIQSIGEIVETIESKSYSTECKGDTSATAENKKPGIIGEGKSESDSRVVIPGDIGKEVEKLIEISKNLERGQNSISGKESKNIFIKEVPVSTITTTMPGRIQTATIIKNPNALQTVKEIPIQSSEGKSKIILVSGRKDVIEGVSNMENSKEEGIIHVTDPKQFSKMSSILSRRKISDGVSQRDSVGNEVLDQSSDSVYIVENKLVIENTDSKSGMSSASTQTPLISSKPDTDDNKTLTSPVFKTITVNVQQPSTIEDCEEQNEDPADKTSQKQSKFVIVHLPEGSTVKRYTVKEEKTEDVPYTEGEDGSFICGICQYTTQKRANWYKHKKKHTTDPPSRPHKCPKCNYRAATSSNLKRHIAIHDDIREFHCQICSMTFRQKIHLERHIKYRHEEKSVMCPLCDYVCANENPDLKIHIKRKHLPHDANDGTIQAYSCDQCGIVTISRKDLKQHMKFHRKGPELKLFCGQCSFVTDCESRLKRHLLIHTKERPFQCGLCDYRGSQKEHVLRHMRSQHQIEVHRRQKKMDSIDDDSDSNIEIEKKTDQSDYSSQEKIFACNHCSMKFAKLINLYKHLHAQHKDILPDPKDDEHLCVVCDFRTTTKKNLLVHMRKHNLQDQNPPSHVYSCVLCKYINPKRRNLFQHMKKKHGIEIVMKDDGSTSCFVTDNTPVVMGRDESVSNILTVGDVVTATTEETPLQIVTDEVSNKDPVPLENVITIEDLAYAVSHPQPVNGNVVIVENQGEETSQIEAVTEHEAAEAIEGLQALAEQPGIIEGQEVVTYDTQQLIIDEAEQQGEKMQTEGIVETEVVTMETEDPSIETEEDKHGEEMGGIQLSQEQLASLSTGDYVEINGEMYKVEISTEENSTGMPQDK